MAKPWKTFTGRCIYQAPGGEKVHQNLFYRWLTLNSDALQTLINRRHPEKPGLSYVHPLTLAARTLPANCCLLGLGGANVAHSVAAHINDLELTAVESNREVIHIASTYFMTDRLKNLKIVHQDANIFVRACQSRYQHVIIDLFNATSFPAHCNTDDFFKRCQQMLLPDGVLAINLANLHEQWPIVNRIRKLFNGCTLSLPVKDTANMVVLAYNGKSVTPLLNLLKGNGYINGLTWDAQWGCVATVGWAERSNLRMI